MLRVYKNYKINPSKIGIKCIIYNIFSIKEKIEIIFSHSRDNKNDDLYLIKPEMKRKSNKLQNSMNDYQQIQYQDYEYNKIQGYESNKLQPVNSKDHNISFKEFSDLKKSIQFKSSSISNWISTIQYFKKNLYLIL